MTFMGEVEGCKPGAEGPSGRARCKKELVSVIVRETESRTIEYSFEASTHIKNKSGNPNNLGTHSAFVCKNQKRFIR